MARLEELIAGATVSGLVGSQTVEIRAVEHNASGVCTVTYRDAHGTLGETLVYREDEHRLTIVEQERQYALTGDGNLFRLASEARRINLAHLFDPYLAVTISNIEPLPHQITAVYESMLPRQPLRYLLADDPGAGKTIMAGLLIKELIARGDLKRCLIVCPGSLIDQWQDELKQKFGVTFKMITRATFEESATGNPFAEYDLALARLDHLSRNEDIQEKLKQTDWDLIVCDEAHKMAAHFNNFDGDIDETQRYKLGRTLSGITRHFLLMTATPHNGNEADFQLFMALLDGDRFEGRFRDGVHQVDVSDLMRRLVKERLVTFESKPLFPERRAHTAEYQLSDLEAQLYARVTDYVRDEWNRADQLKGDKRVQIGFALTSLQRRLASSPRAIHRSLLRRIERLTNVLNENRTVLRGRRLESTLDLPDFGDEDDLTASELEAAEEKVVDLATTAATIAELQKEIETLKGLAELAGRVTSSQTDRKWMELSTVLQDRNLMFDAAGHRRKLIIFTEYKDTLDYLNERISALLGREEAVVQIHGGMGREERRNVQEAFRNDKHVEILIATDAAGEGINLQRANLMVNYDLPWNPNRLEQRFGRIHRIGQTEVCHLWNLVSEDTREGEVYLRLLKKLEAEQKALGGQVFDILGDLFTGRSLKSMLEEAIRYGERADVRARLNQQIDGALDHDHLVKLLEDNAIVPDTMDLNKVLSIRDEMQRAEARRLQPFYIQSFFLEAFRRLGGSIHERESNRFEITNVPADLRQRDRQIGRGAPIQQRYQRITFQKALVRSDGAPPAEFVFPGHPLLDATLDLILERHGHVLTEGAVLIDQTGEVTEPRLIVSLEHTVRDGVPAADGQPREISKRMQFVAVHEDGSVSDAGPAPYLDAAPPTTEQLSRTAPLLGRPLIREQRFVDIASGYASEHLARVHRDEIETRKHEQVEKIRRAVHERLTKEITFHDHRAVQLAQQERAAKTAELNSEKQRRIAEELRARLRNRMTELDQELQITSLPPRLTGAALIVPLHMVEPIAEPTQPVDRDRIERLAVNAVLAAETRLGHTPTEMEPNHVGWDIESKTADGHLRIIEVKGKAIGQETVTISRNQVLSGFNKQDNFILAIGLIDGDAVDLRYVRNAFDREPGFAEASINYDLKILLSQSTDPS